MKPSSTLFLALTAAGLLSAPAGLFASTPGTDNAAQAAYADGWTTGDNGGSGFLAWTLSANVTGAGAAGNFIGSSTQLAGPGANVDTGTSSFGTYGQGTGADAGNFDAFRSFAGGGLAVGQTFSLDLAVNFRNGFKGLDLRSGGATGGNLFNFNIGADDYVVNGAATGNGSIGNAYSDNTAFRLAFTQTSATGGTWTITRSGGVADSDTGTYTGVPDTLHLYVGTTDGGTANNLYANNLSITGNVPEPGTWATVLLSGAGVLGFYSRRRRASAR